MKQEQKLQAIWENIESERKEDYVYPRQSIKMEHAREFGRYNVMGGTNRWAVNDHCRGQINSIISAGFDNYSKTLDDLDMQDLYVRNVNEVLQESDKRSIIRTVDRGQGSVARAFVSDSFKPIDDDIVFGTALQVIGDYHARYKSIGGNRTDTKTYVKIVSKEPIFSLNVEGKNREFSAGFIMSNSEVGCGYTIFQAFLTDHYCNNGIIFSKHVVADVKYMHRGVKVETDFGLLLGDRIKEAEKASIQALICDATKLACNNDNWDALKNTLEASANVRIAGDRAGVVEQIGRRVGLNPHERKQLPFFMEGDTKFAIQAGITKLAQETDDYDRKIELEQAGGDVIQMNSKVWDSINTLSI